MELIQKTFGFFRKRKPSQVHPQPRGFQRPAFTAALENQSLISNLPPEILVQITDHLPTASAALFSLSCRHIYLSLGTSHLSHLKTSHLKHLKTSDLDRQHFLRLLEKDLPDHLFCDDCLTLHSTKEAQKYTPFYKIQEYACLTRDSDNRVWEYISSNFSTVVFKMLMKRYRYFGNDEECRRLLRILDGWEWEIPYVYFRHREKAELRIANGRLVLRKTIGIHGTCVSIERYWRAFLVCPHLSLVKGWRDAFLRLRLGDPEDFEAECEAGWEMYLRCGGGERAMESEVGKCGCCGTEFMVGFEETGTCEVRLGITIWKELGGEIDGGEEESELDWDAGWGDVSWEPESSNPSIKGFEVVKGELASEFERGWPGGDQEVAATIFS